MTKSRGMSNIIHIDSDKRYCYIGPYQQDFPTKRIYQSKLVIVDHKRDIIKINSSKF